MELASFGPSQRSSPEGKKKTAWTTNPSHAKPALLVSPATCIRLAQPQWSSQAHAWVMPVSRSTSTPPTVTANVPGHPPPSSLRSYLDLPTTAQTRLRPQTSRSLPTQSALLYRIGTSFATTLSPAFSPLQPSFFSLLDHLRDCVELSGSGNVILSPP